MSTKDTAQDGPTAFSTPTPHHISDTDVWGPPDRNYYFFVALTFLLGFFGLDHVYLRSNETAMKKFLVNILGLGFWYFWDIIQVLQEGKRIRKEGLNSPLDWIRGIGRGTFLPIPVDMTKEEQAEAKKGPKYAAPKSYIIYTLLAVCLGFLGLDKFYIGDTWRGAAKLFSTLNIFLFLFGLFWVIWDAFHAIFLTKTIMKDGIAVPMPFNFFFTTPTDSSIFKVQPVVESKESTGALGSLVNMVFPLKTIVKDVVGPILQPTIGSAIVNATKLASVGTSAIALGNSALSKAPTLVEGVANQVQTDTLKTVQQLASAKVGQTGGGSAGPGPILAGALTAIVLAGGLKGVADFLAKRHG